MYSDLIVIDWWSPNPHAEFNKNFYSFLKNASKVYVFNDALASSDFKNVILKTPSNRFMRALSVIKICWKHRKHRLIFTSYDDLFLPLIQIFSKKIFCYEHNTTPEYISKNKHAIWQRITFHRIIRLCQSKSQHKVLKEMRQKSFWIGLPISQKVNLPKKSSSPVFIFCSEQFSASEVKLLTPHLYGKVLAKKSLNLNDNINNNNFQIELLDWIEIPTHFLNAEAIVVSIKSSVRGTGWYNEAIAYGIPIIISTADQQVVFESTYPDYPFIKGDSLKSKEDLINKIKNLKNYDNTAYIKNYTKDLQSRLDNVLNKDTNYG